MTRFDRPGIRTLFLATLAGLALVCLPVIASAAGDEALPPAARNATGDGSDPLGAIGDAVEAVGDAITATGQGVVDVGSAAGRLALDAVTGLAAMAASAAVGLARGAAATGDALFATVAWLGAALGAALAASGRTIAWLGGLAWDAFLGYWGIVAALRPAPMPAIAYTGMVATTATATSAAGGWAGWNALRKWGVLGSGLGGVAGFSRIQDSQLLEHPVRADMYGLIQHNPGIHASQLARDLDIGWGTVTHHLQKLEKGRLVAARKVRNQKCYFENGGAVPRGDMAVASAVQSDTAARIAEFVAAHPLTSQKDAADALELSPALVSFHVKKLAAYGVLEKMRHGKQVLLTTTEAMRRVMAAGAITHFAQADGHAEVPMAYSS